MGCLFSGLRKKKNSYHQDLTDDIKAVDIENQKNDGMQSSSQKQLEQKEKAYKLKEEGNILFRQQRYQKAIYKYSLAIEMFPKESIFFTNRALCYVKLQIYERVIEDCNQAIKINFKNFKAHWYLGISLIKASQQQQQCDEDLIKAINDGILKFYQTKQIYLEIQKGQKNFDQHSNTVLQKIEKITRKAKYLKWQKNQEKEQQKQKQFINQMEELLQDNCLEEKDNLLEQIQSHLKNKITKVHTDIPQHFVCPITYDILDQGVTAESGFTYKDEKILREHFVKNGNRDPMTRDALNANIIIQNQAIQQAVADYKDKNPQYYEADNFGEDDELL